MGILEGHSFSDAFVLRWFMKEPCWRAEYSCGVWLVLRNRLADTA